MTLNQILSKTPSKKGLEKNMPVDIAENMGIQFCGDKMMFIIQIYKLLTCEGEMLTYLRFFNKLYHYRTNKLHKVVHFSSYNILNN
ncbi:MAG TPA: hypothetical protein VJH65_03470 [Candidatus Nanoarchaeia archaeon]|nr:hypothetical protein [Candidatus Nanoarchaeia archaeon]